MLQRGRRAPLGEISSIQVSEVGLDQIARDDPFAPSFNPKVGNTSRDLVTYLLALQQKTYGRTTELSYRVLQRNIGLLLKMYSPLQVKRGIRASVRAKYPCTTKFVKYLIEKYFNSKEGT